MLTILLNITGVKVVGNTEAHLKELILKFSKPSTEDPKYSRQIGNFILVFAVVQIKPGFAENVIDILSWNYFNSASQLLPLPTILPRSPASREASGAYFTTNPLARSAGGPGGDRHLVAGA